MIGKVVGTIVGGLLVACFFIFDASREDAKLGWSFKVDKHALLDQEDAKLSLESWWVIRWLDWSEQHLRPMVWKQRGLTLQCIRNSKSGLSNFAVYAGENNCKGGNERTDEPQRISLRVNDLPPVIFGGKRTYQPDIKVCLWQFSIEPADPNRADDAKLPEEPAERLRAEERHVFGKFVDGVRGGAKRIVFHLEGAEGGTFSYGIKDTKESRDAVSNFLNWCASPDRQKAQ